MRPIDANQLSKDIVERGAQLSGCYSAGIARYMDRMLANVLAEVDIAPTVDAVPVVRCKDCVYRVIVRDPLTGTMDCYGCKVMHYNEDDWFCSFGERKDDE